MTVARPVRVRRQRRVAAGWLLVLVANVAGAARPADAVSGISADSQTRPDAATRKIVVEDKLHDLQKQLDSLAEQQREAEGERTDASKALRVADNNVGQATRSLHETEAAIQAQEARLVDLQAQQTTLAKRLSHQREQLALLVRSAYTLGGNEQLKLLLAQDRVVDLARAMAYNRYFEQDRLRRIHGLTDQLRTLADLSHQVETQKSALAASEAEQAARLKVVQTQRNQRGQLIASIDASYHDRAARIAAMSRDANELEELVRKLSLVMAHAPPVPSAPHPHPAVAATPHPTASIPVNPPAAGFSGRMPWPMNGRVVSGHGEGGSGLLIEGSVGEEVHAIADGRVAFANWLKGYGLLVIIDHGNGLMSLYANNDALLKNAGDSVHAGDAVSTVGSSGGQARNALYFEIRQNGKAVDPRTWLRVH